MKRSNCRICPGRGGDSIYERGGDARRLALGCKFQSLVSLRGGLGKTPLYLAVKVSFRVALEEILKKYIFNSFYLLNSCNQSLGVKKRLCHAQIGLL